MTVCVFTPAFSSVVVALCDGLHLGFLVTTHGRREVREVFTPAFIVCRGHLEFRGVNYGMYSRRQRPTEQVAQVILELAAEEAVDDGVDAAGAVASPL